MGMWRYKTWRFRLMSGYRRRSIGASIMTGARLHTSGYWDIGYNLGLSRSRIKTRDEGDRLAHELIFGILHKDGNFYINHNGFPLWRQRLENRYRLFSCKLYVLRAALLFKDDVGFLD